MTDKELSNALDGLFAYDTGATDSGIHDESLRQRCIDEIWLGMTEHESYTQRLSKIARELYMTDEAIDQGYGLETVVEFASWLDEEMR